MPIPIVQYNAKYVPNPNPEGGTSYDAFWEVWEAVLNACRKFGTAGPDLSYGSKLDFDVRYWVIDDQYNDDLYQNMEVAEPEGWSSEWMLELMACLTRHPGWGVSIANTDQGHLLVFADLILVTGPTFANCADLESVVGAARRAAEDMEERKTGPLKRQLAYVRQQLPSAMAEADRSGYSYIATFNGYQLHEGHAIWVLQKQYQDELLLDTYYGPVRISAITPDGTIHDEYSKSFSPYNDTAPPYWLATYIEEDRARTTFHMIEEQTKIVGTITISKVVDDTELIR